MARVPRLHCPVPLASGAELDLPAAAARHVQVLRLQPGGRLVLFGGSTPAQPARRGGEFEATVLAIGRSTVRVRVGDHHAIEREGRRPVHLALGMPANERMDWLIEKAVELGVASLQPLMTERTVVRLDGERAHRRAGHWAGIAVAACEQCGRNQVPPVAPVAALTHWLPFSADDPQPGMRRLLLSLHPDARPLQVPDNADTRPITVLTGPEGGLSPAEERLALAQGFEPVSLGARVLRAETAALAALTLLA